MSRFESREALVGKIEWEGGLEAALGYGIRVGDMPEGDDELRDAWRDLEEAWLEYDQLADRVEELLGMDES